jgi:hypothetical protein
VYTADLVLERVNVHDNTITIGPADVAHGAVNLSSGTMDVDGLYVYRNTVTAASGISGLEASDAILRATELLVDDNVFVATGTDGGSVFRVVGGDLQLERSTIRGNTSSGAGSMVLLSDDTRQGYVMRNVLVSENLEGFNAGMTITSGVLALEFVTITDNYTSSDATPGHTLTTVAAVLDLNHCIVADNRSVPAHPGIASDNLSASYTDFWASAPGVSTFSPTTFDPLGADGNISVDPQLAADGTLDRSSPVRDAGNPAILDVDQSTADLGATGGPTPLAP